MTAGDGKPAGLTVDQFLRFRDLIYSKSGLHFQEARKFLLESRLPARIQRLGLRGADEYFLYLRYDAGGPAEMGRLLEAVTNNETAFFRTPGQFEVFRREILPRCAQARKDRGENHLKFWSAGCSTGEEPYTLAILVREALGPGLGGKTVAITAHDISERALEAARAGKYTEASLKAVPEDLRSRFFSPNGGGAWQIEARLRQIVDFRLGNLAALAPGDAPQDVDVAFCRNVLIYFDAASKKKVLDAAYDALRPGGYLVVGATESLHGVTRAFKMIVHSQAVVYQKEVSP